MVCMYMNGFQPKRIGLIDVDATSRGKVTFPNLALMKLSAWHKSIGDTVEWYDPMLSGHMDIVYMSKVFSDEYTKDYQYYVDADKIIRGGSGYAIHVKEGRQCYNKEQDNPLPYEVQHIMPDYSLYEITENSYGFLTRGCPRGCDFCHVAAMQGRKSYTVARLSQFWSGQKYIHLLDPNILACHDWEMHFDDLIESKSYVDFSQGLDIRLLTKQKIQKLNDIRYSMIHFAWDRPQQDLRSNFITAKQNLKRCTRSNTSCYILTNNGSSIQQDIARVEFIKSMNIQPYVMVYRESTAPQTIKKLKRYANNPYVCWATPTFDDYVAGTRSDRYQKTGIEHKKINKIGT